jgi:alanyl-tRNA synthetase
MDAMTLRQVFLDYFRAHDHAILSSAPLVPEHDSSVLFTPAGMHPLVPYLLGESHPAGSRLASCQKCLRTNDILEVGDAVHLTFFEMLGNWSLEDYWKPESIRLSLTFLIDQLGLDPERLFVTCFAGDATVPRDDEAAAVWRALGIPEQRVAFLRREDNWWGPVGATGPCGPDTEIFYDMRPDDPAPDSPATNPQRFCEIWNNVFMQYDLQPDGTYRRLARHNVDTGMGLERTLTALQGVPSPYETELFVPIIAAVRTLAPHSQPLAERIIADHVRAAMFILAEQIVPGNVGQPYIARRLIRRASRYGLEIGITKPFLARLAEVAIPTLASTYPELEQQHHQICQALDEEETRFARTLTRGAQEVDKAIAASKRHGEQLLPGTTVFRLYETYGFPAELTQEVATEQGLGTDMAGFLEAFRAHQQQSRHGASDHFRGGLAE